MKLRTKYILFVLILHLVTLVLSFFILQDQKLIFIGSEVLILFSAFIAWQLYLELIKPLKTLMSGIDAMKDRDFNVKFLLTGKFEMDKLITVYNDMMEHLRVERVKQEEQHFFLEKLINTSPTGILVLDFDENIHQLNPKALTIIGLPEKELVGHPIRDMNSILITEIGRLATGESKTISINGMETYKLQKSHFIDRGFARYFVMIEEVTAEILAAEKKAYGKLIRMMAHEVNNTIGPVNSILQSTLNSKEHTEILQYALQVAINRNNNLNIFMRNFADVVRLPLPNKKNVNLDAILMNVTALMHLRASEKAILFQQEKTIEPLMIFADPQQMEQVLINIFKNAIEAIEEKGTITVITHLHPKQLIIRDTGKGISPEITGQLFSPFFSTKKDGQGLGLTLIREILLNHGFEFYLKTRGEANTEFMIAFE